MIYQMSVGQVIDYLSQFDPEKKIRCIASDCEEEVEGQLYLNSFDGEGDIEFDVKLESVYEIVYKERV